MEKFHTQEPFSASDIDDLQRIARLTKQVTKLTRKILIDFPQDTLAWRKQAQANLAQALADETHLNNLRKQLLRDRRERILAGQTVSPDAITAYADILNNFERIGDYALRIDENLLSRYTKEKTV